MCEMSMARNNGLMSAEKETYDIYVLLTNPPTTSVTEKMGAYSYVASYSWQTNPANRALERHPTLRRAFEACLRDLVAVGRLPSSKCASSILQQQLSRSPQTPYLR